MSEWLRSVTRNHMGFPRTGSNPVGVVAFYFFVNRGMYLYVHIGIQRMSILLPSHSFILIGGRIVDFGKYSKDK